MTPQKHLQNIEVALNRASQAGIFQSLAESAAVAESFGVITKIVTDKTNGTAAPQAATEQTENA